MEDQGDRMQEEDGKEEEKVVDGMGGDKVFEERNSFGVSKSFSLNKGEF